MYCSIVVQYQTPLPLPALPTSKPKPHTKQRWLKAKRSREGFFLEVEREEGRKEGMPFGSNGIHTQ